MQIRTTTYGSSPNSHPNEVKIGMGAFYANAQNP